MDFRVISIGTMAANGLWNEREPQRTGHSTTTLIRTTAEDGSEITILVDPGLPEAALVARLRERVNLGPEAITHVYLTSFHPDCRRGLGAFERARWLISEREREAVGVPLVQSLKRLAENFDEPDEAARTVLQTDIAILQRCEPAPDRLGQGVDLFPMPGVSPGLCGLLLTTKAGPTALVCGDAIPTQDHLERAEIPRHAADVSTAKDSFAEAIEIADYLILGRDNLVPNMTRRPF